MTSRTAYKPDLVIQGLSLWIAGRRFPDAIDPFDAEENRCHAVTETTGARVELDGNIPSRNVHFFLQSLTQLYETLTGEAVLDGSDMGLIVRLRPEARGHIRTTVQMSPDFNIDQKHEFNFGCDQTYLPPIVIQCRQILARYPMLAKIPS